MESKPKVLMITADGNLGVPGTEANQRLLLQEKYADITPVFWGRGALILPFRVGGAFDVVSVQDPFWRGLVGLLLARRKQARLNVQVHTDLEAQGPLRHSLARFVLRHADSVRVVSEKLREQAEEMGVTAPISVLPIYIDIERFCSIERAPRGGEHKTILWVGRFEEEKDPLRAIDVLNEVREGGVDAKLVMLGTGSLENELKKRAEELPVTFAGWQDPAPFYASADVLLNTSRYEGYGVAMVEALAAGVPVIAPDVGIAREAGAIVVDRDKLAEAITNTLRSGTRGELQLPLLSQEEWGRQWSKTL
ncbi:MAG: glycosyltransferase [Candidatus Pacebacteria bacterium]|nr:glycosyltransferase [Candidatus Paceibacterota bacterium]